MHPPDDDNLTPATASSVEEGARALEEGMAEGTAPDGGDPVGDAGGGAGEAAPRLDISRRTSWLQLIIVCIASFATWTGFGAIMPYLPLFLKEEEHSSMLLIGVIASMFYVGTLLFSSPLGWASDTFGRKPIMVFGVTLVAFAMVLFTTTSNPYWFILFRLLEGIGTAAVGPAGQAFIADITDDKDRSKAYGILTSAQFGGLIIGPALGAVLLQLGGGGRSGFYLVFYFGAALCALTALAMLFFVKEPVASRARIQRRLDRAAEGKKAERPPYRTILTPAILAFVVVAFTSHFAMGAFDVVWSIWLDHLGASTTYIAATWTAFSVPMLLSFAGGMLADRHSRFRLMFVGYAFSAVAWILYGVTRDLTLFLIVNVLEGVAIAFSYPAKQAFLVQVSPKRWLGTVTGVETSAMQLAGLLGTLTAPILYDVISGYVISVGGVFSLIGLGIAAPVLSREWRRIEATGDKRSTSELEALADEVRPRDTSAAERPYALD